MRRRTFYNLLGAQPCGGPHRRSTSLIRSHSFLPHHTHTHVARESRSLSHTLSRSLNLSPSLLRPRINVWLASAGEWGTYVLLCSLSEVWLAFIISGQHAQERIKYRRFRVVKSNVCALRHVRCPRIRIVSVSAGTIWTGNFVLRPWRRARPTSERGTPGYIP